MGLPEKRIAMAMEKDNFGDWKKKVKEACDSAQLQFEVNWEELVKEGFASYYPKNVDFNFFEPLKKALESICEDELGRTSFKKKIKKVRITSRRNWSSLEVKIEGDTLHLDADPSYGKQQADTTNYPKLIREALEKVL